MKVGSVPVSLNYPLRGSGAYFPEAGSDFFCANSGTYADNIRHWIIHFYKWPEGVLMRGNWSPFLYEIFEHIGEFQEDQVSLRLGKRRQLLRVQ